MQLRQIYEALLIELHKEHAPNITLETFNYLVNKAVYQFINKKYNIYDINQQTTDDLRVLKGTAKLPVIKDTSIYGGEDLGNYMDSTYFVQLPDDYFHLLSCMCFFDVNSTYKCYNKNTVYRVKATRLTADSWAEVVDNFWMRPNYDRPYYYINNVNSSPTVPTNSYNKGIKEANKKIVNAGTDLKEKSNTTQTDDTKIEVSNDPFRQIDINGFMKSGDSYKYPQRIPQVRYGNASKVIMEIRYGTDDSVFKLKNVVIDYIKVPQHLNLTQEQVDKTLDYSQTMEFPDYVCQEIINELVHITMENIADQRLQTHPVVSQSIANPAQQQTETNS